MPWRYSTGELRALVCYILTNMALENPTSLTPAQSELFKNEILPAVMTAQANPGDMALKLQGVMLFRRFMREVNTESATERDYEMDLAFYSIFIRGFRAIGTFFGRIKSGLAGN